jgi:CRP-like cAMP-binding protein
MNPRHNALLEHLPISEYGLFLADLELVSLVRGDVLFETDQAPSFVYFPVGALISIICEVEDDFSVELNMVGKNSMVGVSNIGVPSFYKAEVRSSGFAYRMEFNRFREMRKSCPAFLKAQAHAQLNAIRYIALTGACSKLHTIEQQLVRWLLVNIDRNSNLKIVITHNDLSRLLGFRREAITLTLGRLAELGWIKLGRGELEVVNRNELERMTCQCYWRISTGARLARG